MTSHEAPRPSIRTAILCGSGPSVNRLRELAAGYPKLSVNYIADIELVLVSRLWEDHCGIIIPLDAALRLLQPGDLNVSLSGHPPVLVLLPGMGLDNEIGQQLLQRGVSGFLNNGCGMDVVDRAILRTSMGELWAGRAPLSLAFKQSLVDSGLNRLTPRELEIVGWLVEGATNQQIAERLFVTRETVRWHLRAVYTKLGVHTRGAVVEFIGSAQKSPQES